MTRGKTFEIKLMSNKYFRKCFACHCGYKCKQTQRLPRKTKKFYKRFLVENNKFFYRGWMENATSCELAACYRADRNLIQTLPMINKYRKELEALSRYCENNMETFYIMPNGRLGWYWEHDSEYGATEGVMEFCYSPEEAGDTWAFSEVEALVNRITRTSNCDYYVNSDKSLLELIRSYSKRKWMPYPSEECLVCKSTSAEVFTRSNRKGFVYDGEYARCKNCHFTGTVCVEDSECADIIWDHDDDDQPVQDF